MRNILTDMMKEISQNVGEPFWMHLLQWFLKILKC